MSLRSVRKCSGCLHLHYLSSNFLQMLRKQARQTIVDHSASSWYSPDPSHEPASEHNEDSPCAPSLLNLQAPKGDRTAQGMVGISGASLQKQLLEGSGENTWAPCHWRALGVPWGSSSQSGSGLRAEGLSGFTEIELGTAPKRQQASRRPFLLADRVARWDPHQMTRLTPEERLPYRLLLLLWWWSTRSKPARLERVYCSRPVQPRPASDGLGRLRPGLVTSAFMVIMGLRVSRRIATQGQQRRANQSSLREISAGCSSEGLMLQLKLQYFSHLMLGKIEGRRRRGRRRMRWLDGITDSMGMSLGKLQV